MKDEHRRRVLHHVSDAMRSVTVVLLMVSVFSIGVPSIRAAAAHNIDVKKAKEKAQEYARKKVGDPNRNYKHFMTDCLAAFPGHNHYVRCSIFYQDADRKQLCKERIEVYLPNLTFLMDIKHTSSNDC